MKAQKKTIYRLRPWDHEDDYYIESLFKDATIDDFINVLLEDIEHDIKMYRCEEMKALCADDPGMNYVQCRKIRYAIRDLKHHLAAFQSYVEKCEREGELK